MEHDNRNPKGDQRQPGDNSGASTGTKVKMYPYNVNGVRLSTGTNHVRPFPWRLTKVLEVEHRLQGSETVRVDYTSLARIER